MSTQTIETTRSALIQWAEQCLTLCQKEGDITAVTAINGALARYKEDRFVFSIMGLAKRGKSTLINALLDRTDDHLAPVDKLPATSVTTTFSWAKELAVEVIYRSGQISKIQPEDIREYATEEGNPENRKEIQLIRVSTPCERLRSVTLVDLPGGGSIHEHHDQIIHQFLPQSDAVLLLTTARMPINEQDLDLLRAAREADIAKLFVAINQIDKTDPEELRQCETHNRKQLTALKGLKALDPTIYKISALQAFNGDFEHSGVAALWNDIDTLLQNERGNLMNRRLVASVFQAASPVLQALAVRAAAANKNPAEIAADKSRLASEKKNIEVTRGILEKKFLNKWNAAVDVVANQLPSIERNVLTELLAEIEKIGMGSAKKKAKELPTIFSRSLEDKLTPVFTKMENTLRESTQELNAHYPQLIIDATGTAYINADPDPNFVKKLVSAGVLAAGGLGIVAATSAAIAATVTLVPAAGLGTATALGGGLLAAFGFPELVPVAAAGIATIWPSTAVAAPSMLMLVAGPVGWTIAGIGALAIPVAWLISNGKLKRTLREQFETTIKSTFEEIKNSRLSRIRSQGEMILDEFRLNLEHRLLSIEQALESAALHVEDPAVAAENKRRFNELDQLLASHSKTLFV